MTNGSVMHFAIKMYHVGYLDRVHEDDTARRITRRARENTLQESANRSDS